MFFDKIFIPSHVSMNHIKMCSWTAKSYHSLFIVSSKLWTDCKKDVSRVVQTVSFHKWQFQNSALSLGVNGFILK